MKTEYNSYFEAQYSTPDDNVWVSTSIERFDTIESATKANNLHMLSTYRTDGPKTRYRVVLVQEIITVIQ